jgi:hypothetical protein
VKTKGSRRSSPAGCPHQVLQGFSAVLKIVNSCTNKLCDPKPQLYKTTGKLHNGSHTKMQLQMIQLNSELLAEIPALGTII